MTANDNKKDEKYLDRARELLRIEAAAIERASSRLGETFTLALHIIIKAVQNSNKLILLGVGKNQYVAQKLAASFMSTGVTAFFVHPSEALHGDLGSIREGDVLIMFSKSGGTSELLSLLSYLKGRNKVIAIVGDLKSPLAKLCDIVLDASVEKEACPINMLPTASTTAALAMGDALVACLAEEQGFSKQTFAGYHPGGSIGKRLNSYVRDVYHRAAQCATGTSDSTLQEVAQVMSSFALGAFCALKADGALEGLITEGDLRRAIARGENMQNKALSILNLDPLMLKPQMLIDDAIASLEQKDRRVNCAPVIDDNGKFLGLVHIHDLI